MEVTKYYCDYCKTETRQYELSPIRATCIVGNGMILGAEVCKECRDEFVLYVKSFADLKKEKKE